MPVIIAKAMLIRLQLIQNEFKAMRVFLLIALILGLSPQLCAQFENGGALVEIRKSDPFEVEKGYGLIQKYITRDDETLKVTIIENGIQTSVEAGIRIQKFKGRDFDLVENQKIIEMPHDFHFLNLLELGQHIYVFFTSYKLGDFNVIVREIDFTTATFMGEGYKFLERYTEPDDLSVSRERMSSPTIYVTANEDHSGCVISNWMFKDGDINDKWCGLSVLDKELSVLWSTVFALPRTEEYPEATVNSFLLDNGNNFHMLTSRIVTDQENPKWRRGMPITDIILHSIIKNDSNIKSLEVQYTGHATDVSLFERNSRLIVGGFASLYPNRGVSSLFLNEIKDGELLLSNQFEIPEAVRNKFVDPESFKKNRHTDSRRIMTYGAMVGLQLSYVRLLSDGSMVFVGDKLFDWNLGLEGHQIAYHNFETLVMVIKDNKLSGTIKLPINQSSYYFIRIGNFYSGKDDELYIYFVDNINNSELLVSDKHESFSEGRDKGELTAFKIDLHTLSTKKIQLINLSKVVGKGQNFVRIPTLNILSNDNLFFEIILRDDSGQFVIIENK